MQHPSEIDVVTARGNSILMIVVTILLTCCWLIFNDHRIPAAMFISGLIAVMTWQTYCQLKTSVEVLSMDEKSSRG